jgi:hypothetical protein
MSDKNPKGILLYWGEYIGNIYAIAKMSDKSLRETKNSFKIRT